MARFDNRRHAMDQGARSVGQDDSQDDATFALAGAASVLGAGVDIPDAAQFGSGGADAAPPRQIVFIEGDVPDAEALADGVAPGVRAVILNAGADGMQQIAAYLASHDISDLASISIVAHGSDAAVALGSGVLSAATIGQYMSELAVIGAAVRPGGDLQLFGCDVAADPAGVAFLDQVSAATGVANVAASSHLVGAAADGGSWTLNVDVGAPTVSQPFTAAAEAAYPDVLGTTTDRLYDVADTFLNTNEADTQILDLGVNGGAVSGSQGTVVNDTNGALGLANNQFYGLAIDTPNQKYYLTTYNGNGGGNNEIFAGSLAGGTPTAIFTQATNPSNINGGNDFFQIDGLALDQPNGELYFADSEMDFSGNGVPIAGQSGIYKISVNGGSVTPVVTGADFPGALALDTAHNVVFFTDSGVTISNSLDAGSLSGGKAQVLNSELPSALSVSLSGFNNTDYPFLSGVAVDTATETLYFTAYDEHLGDITDGFIDSIGYSVSNGVVTLKTNTLTTLYSGANAGEPESIVIDPANGIFYVTNQETQAIEEGSLTATDATAVTTVYTPPGVSSSETPFQPTGLVLVSGPAVNAGGSVSFTGGSGASVTLDPGLSVSDSASTTLASATVVLGGFQSGDTLTVGTPGGLSSAFNNGTLTLSGTASLATYQTALESVQYSTSPTDTDPTHGGGDTPRTITWTVSDGVDKSGPGASTLDTIHVPGTVTAGGSVTYTGPSAVVLDQTVTVSDPDSGGDLTGATVSIGAGFSAGDALVFTDQNGISGAYNAAVGVETLTGVATLANYQTALESVAFDTTSPVESVRTINWNANDGAQTTSASSSTVNVICFCAGTMIATPDGEVPVQALQPGALVLTLRNGARAVKWVGRGKVLATRGQRGVATPVIVRQGALGDGVPARDLHVTKAHALYLDLDEVLIPAEFLVNGRTILWDDRAQEVEIYHVELDSHDVLLANGAAAESFRDDGNRWLFQNGYADADWASQEPYAPVLTGGPVVDAVWRRLLDRAGPLVLPPLTDDPDLHLVVDGVRVDPLYRRDAVYGFRLPGRPTSVVVASRAGVPASLGTVRDPRTLGVALRQVTMRQGARFMLIDADDERLSGGFHGYEPADRLRWTNGAGVLPAGDFARFDAGAEVIVRLGGATQYPLEARAAA